MSAAEEYPGGSKPWAFGEMIPYGDPNWYQDWHSPYYNDTHRALRAKIRKFVDDEITPNCHEWDEAKTFPPDLLRKASKEGWMGACVGSPWPEKYLGKSICGGIVTAEQWDPFHELVVVDELARCGSGGICWGLAAGLTIGLPPVLNFGSEYLQDRVAKPCMQGEKVICLCITEPQAGSDVANLTTSAVKTADGKHYIVNGQKKWITNGVFADFFTVAVRTGGAGMGGISLLLLEKGMPGLTCTQMKCGGVWSSGTTYIEFDDVKVPVENIIGVENQGFKCIMYNFNHERWWIVVQANRFARICYEDR
jgi:alkylation response protein AidB-like acyl-CoA dehydrogenase